MKPELKGPKVEHIFLAIVQEEGENDALIYNAYLINEKEEALEQLLVSSNGYVTIEKTKEKIKTTTLRKSFGTIEPRSSTKIEPIMEDVLKLNNEYLISFWIGDQLYDKKFIFLAESIKEENFVNVPILNKKGVVVG